MNTTEELKFVKEVAEATGVVLDPVYRFELLCFVVDNFSSLVIFCLLYLQKVKTLVSLSL